jgi:hypothetical protein
MYTNSSGGFLFDLVNQAARYDQVAPKLVGAHGKQVAAHTQGAGDFACTGHAAAPQDVFSFLLCQLIANIGEGDDIHYVRAGDRDHDGTIQKMNFVAARLLGMERSRLVGGRLGHFVSREHRSTFKAILLRIFESEAREVCEVTLDPGARKSAVLRVNIAYVGDVDHIPGPQQDYSYRSLAITLRG